MIFLDLYFRARFGHTLYLMSQDNLIKLKSSASGHIIWTRKNKKKLSTVKLSLKKFDPKAKKRVVYKEAKK